MKKWLVVMLVAAGAVGCGDPFRDPKIEALGGEQACREAYVFNHTPTPAEQERMRQTQ